MNLLLADTIRFLEENFDPSTKWITSPQKAQLLQKKLTSAKPPVTTPTPPQVLKSPIPEKSFAPEKKEEIPPPICEKEVPKPTLPSIPLGVEDLSKAVKDLFPQFSTQMAPPQEKEFFLDLSYKKALKANVVLFSFREGKESDLFLQNINRALHLYFPNSTIIDMKKWEQELSNFTPFFQETEARLFIASQALYKKPHLLPFLKEKPISSERFLGKGKLLLLADFETYFLDPTQKKELWKTLCTLLSLTAPSQASS